MKKIVIFASGSGTNAENIASFYASNPHVKVELVLSNNPHAGVFERMQRLDVPVVYYDNRQFKDGEAIVMLLQEQGIDLIVLAGFMNKISAPILEAYKGRILNIHPALLPKYGGKGMYGMHVHEAVVAAGEKETGITIHHVNEHYDEGQIIFQATCPVLTDDSPEALAQRVHQLEYQHYPQVIDSFIKAM